MLILSSSTIGPRKVLPKVAELNSVATFSIVSFRNGPVAAIAGWTHMPHGYMEEVEHIPATIQAGRSCWSIVRLGVLTQVTTAFKYIETASDMLQMPLPKTR